MLPHISASCLAVFFVTCPPCITAHDLSALGDAQESRCIEGYCQLSTSVHGNDFTPACLPFVTRTTTTTMTTLVSTTGTLVTTLDGEATSSQLTLKPLSSSSGSTIGIGNQGDNGHQRLSTPGNDGRVEHTVRWSRHFKRSAMYRELWMYLLFCQSISKLCCPRIGCPPASNL